MFNPALTTCASERMKTKRFSYFATFAARERMREAKPEKTEEERKIILDAILPKMLISGFVTVSIASVLLAGFMAKLI